MTNSKSQEDIVGAQFGAQAEAYRHSAVHAQGADLDALVAIAKSRRGCRVLDLGCGGGRVTLNVAPHAVAITAYDLAPEMLAVTVKAAANCFRKCLALNSCRPSASSSLPGIRNGR